MKIDSMDAIDKIENGLRFAVDIKGEAVQQMTLADRLQHHRVPGVSIAVVQDGEIKWSKGYGLTQAGLRRKVEPQTLFQAASISKPVSALAALSLVERGLLELDQDVNERLFSWRVHENELTRLQKVTLRRLLSHNAGLTVHGFPGYAFNEELPTIPQILDGEPPANTPAVRVDVKPGTIWRYSGGGTTLAQLLMMDITGLPFADVMRKYALDPIGMNDSTFAQPLPEHRRSDAAAAHHVDGQPYAGCWHTYPEQAAAGLWTTPSDLARFIIALQKTYTGLSTSVISQAVVREMLSVQAGDFGLGLGLGGEGKAAYFRHGGSNAGFRCMMLGFIHSGQGIVVMSNGDRGDELVFEIIRAAALAYGWTGFYPTMKETVVLQKEILSYYAGHYQFIDFPDEEIELRVDDGQLVLYLKKPFEDMAVLYAQSEGSFFRKENGMEIAFSEGEWALSCEMKFGKNAYRLQRVD